LDWKATWKPLVDVAAMLGLVPGFIPSFQSRSPAEPTVQSWLC